MSTEGPVCRQHQHQGGVTPPNTPLSYGTVIKSKNNHLCEILALLELAINTYVNLNFNYKFLLLKYAKPYNNFTHILSCLNCLYGRLCYV